MVGEARSRCIGAVQSSEFGATLHGPGGAGVRKSPNRCRRSTTDDAAPRCIHTGKSAAASGSFGAGSMLHAHADWASEVGGCAVIVRAACFRDSTLFVLASADRYTLVAVAILEGGLAIAPKEQGGRVHYLPACSPELNPDEIVWNNLKNDALGREVIVSREAQRKMVVSHLRPMQKLPALIMSRLMAPTTPCGVLCWQQFRDDQYE